ncbi:MAG: FecR domain-containing protein [Actinomycetota bacterium]
MTAGLVLAALLFITAGPATAKEFATLHLLEGTVEVQRGDGQFGPGGEGQTLQAGDTVRTGPDGRAEIEYFDGSLTRLDLDTSFTLRELASLQDEPDSKVIEAEQAEGRTFERVTAITDSQSRFDVETPTATASVRGTSYLLTVHPGGGTELWVLPDDEPGASTVILILEDGTEIVVSEGQGVLVNPDGSIDGPFVLTDEQLEDGFVLFNQCQDDPGHPDCQVEVEPKVVENDGQDPDDPFEPDVTIPPTQPEVVEPEPTGEGTGGGGGGGGDGGDQDEPSDRRSVVITLSWSSGPSNLDLHVLTPDVEEDEGGEVWSGNPCLAREDGSCWAFASGDAVGFGSETVTLRPIGDPEDGDWLKGGYRVWVENTSCQDGPFADSDAAVTISRAGGESVSLPVSGATGDRTLETWNVGSVFMSQDGSMAVAGTQSTVGDPCGPPVGGPVRFKGVGERGYQVVQPEPPRDKGGDDGGTGTEGGEDGEMPPAPEPEPQPAPEPEPPPEPEPEPDPEQEPEPEPEPEPTPPDEPPADEVTPSGLSTDDARDGQ